MSSEKVSPFDDIAEFLLGMSRDASEAESEPYEIDAIALDVPAPHDVHASNIPDLQRRFEWSAGRVRGTTRATIRRTTQDVVILWHNEPPNTEQGCGAHIRSPWFLDEDTVSSAPG